jgi:dienelactone hydrolase
LTLRGFVRRPAGVGPFPAIIWNHGSERLPSPQDELGSFYTSAGFVFLAPHRHGHGCSPGEYALANVTGGIESVIELQEGYLEDTLAAVRWLRDQPFVDSAQMAMSGVSHGGIQTLLAAEAEAGMRAYVPFAPAAMGWRGNPELQERLLRAVKAARAPMFLLQAENDYSLGPSEVLGKELKRKGEPNRARVYPAYGSAPESGHGEFARHGMDVWGGDVRAFLDGVLESSPTDL